MLVNQALSIFGLKANRVRSWAAGAGVSAPGRGGANNIDIAHRAAEYRARYGLRTPDAIHVATAVQARAEVFLTNDRRLRRVEEIDVLLVEDLKGEDV